MPRRPRNLPKSIQTPFSIELERQILESGKSYADVAREAEVPRSQISRYRLGTNRTVSPDLLAKLAQVVSSKPADQARLIAAHMESHGYGLYPGFIQIRVAGDTAKPSTRPKTEEETALLFLAKKAKEDSKTRALVLALADALGMK